MNQQQRKPAEPKKTTTALRRRIRVCASAVMQPCGGNLKTEFATCPYPQGSSEELFRSFQNAPQFREIDAKQLLRAGAQGLRVILLSEDAYYARQAALYLSALAAQMRQKAEPDEDEDGLELDEMLNNMLGIGQEDGLRQSLAVAASKLLDPELGAAEVSARAAALAEQKVKTLQLSELDVGGLLVWAESGPVLTPAVVTQLETCASRPMDLFVALNGSQVDTEQIDALCFYQRFLVCRVQDATDEYRKQVLREALRLHGHALAAGADPDRILANLRRVRGQSFDEGDLYALAAWAAARSGDAQALQTEHLLYQPFQPRCGGGSGMDELNAMPGLEGVKGALKRQLAADIFSQRREQRGVLCRNMAFSGAPGTGKSVTARLVARILREAGCGTGRFVEAGREQLIGTYLGQTSPKIAQLFEQARGGVLFIDEAGALIPGNGDIYAEEAVNALVRHMELHPETLVIFATYPDEMRRLLDANPGLSSRVARTLEFSDYTDGQLWTILEGMAAKLGLTLPEAARADCEAFFRELRRRKGRNFGNGREARRLIHAAFEELALRAADESAELSAADLAAAAAQLLEMEAEAPARTIGF